MLLIALDKANTRLNEINDSIFAPKTIPRSYIPSLFTVMIQITYGAIIVISLYGKYLRCSTHTTAAKNIQQRIK